ncbi:MAG: type II toxin-antitoxin system RelE/ParE family toxin [Cellvibrionaceae bacterium]|nr:type II toxin-antitoxin system RelE/ParE family toxin [Cellvibrionaceae bacterium]MCV6626425.1 type II toxin-antitoxin system RelE/ParE family toxin [Cellvibrionaceae bacterium]
MAAQRAAKKILEGAKILIENPEAGVPVEGLSAYRDLILPFGAGDYIIRYHVEAPSRVVIVRVRHSREEGFN